MFSPAARAPRLDISNTTRSLRTLNGRGGVGVAKLSSFCLSGCGFEIDENRLTIFAKRTTTSRCEHLSAHFLRSVFYVGKSIHPFHPPPHHKAKPPSTVTEHNIFCRVTSPFHTPPPPTHTHWIELTHRPIPTTQIEFAYYMHDNTQCVHTLTHVTHMRLARRTICSINICAISLLT